MNCILKSIMLCPVSLPLVLSAVWPPAQGCLTTWTIRRSSSPCEMPRWLPGTRSDHASTAAVTSSTASLFAYQVEALALYVALPPSLHLSCTSPHYAFCVIQVLQISCRPTMRATYAASSRLCLKSWQPNVNRVTTINKRKVRKVLDICYSVSVQATDTNNNQSRWFRLLLLWCPAGPVLRSAVLEDCALCQETLSSSEVAAKAREGQFEGQQIHTQPCPGFAEMLACCLFSAADVLMAGDRFTCW